MRVLYTGEYYECFIKENHKCNIGKYIEEVQKSEVINGPINED